MDYQIKINKPKWCETSSAYLGTANNIESIDEHRYVMRCVIPMIPKQLRTTYIVTSLILIYMSTYYDKNDICKDWLKYHDFEVVCIDDIKLKYDLANILKNNKYDFIEKSFVPFCSYEAICYVYDNKHKTNIDTDIDNLIDYENNVICVEDIM